MSRKTITTRPFKEMVISGDGSGKSKEITLKFDGQNYGRGAFGVVRAAKLMETGENVAVKIARTNAIGKEVKHLKELKHCNIVNMLYYFLKETSSGDLECIVMEAMPTTLSEVCRAAFLIPVFEGKLYMYQMLRALAYMHAKGICHRDLKPENVLIDYRTGIVKLCDFGSSTRLSPYSNDPRVGTFYYMAPEMLFNYRNYTKRVDMWSAGCIFVEILKGGERLFGEAENEIELFTTMIDYFGTPTESEFSGLEPSYPIAAIPKKEAKPWSDILSPYPISEDAISLCSELLCYSPKSRLRPRRALAHKYFDVLRSPETRFLGNGKPLPPLFNFQPDEFGHSYDLRPLHKRGKNSYITAFDSAKHKMTFDRNIRADNMFLRAYRMFRAILAIFWLLLRALKNTMF